MADSKRRGSATKSRKPATRAAGKPEPRARSETASQNGMSAIDAVQSARRHLTQLLGRPVEAVLGVDRDHGNWVVVAQVVELERIPNTMDVLGDYEAVLDKHGEVVACRRTNRYRRGQVDGG